jgi:hypothetical protein
MLRIVPAFAGLSSCHRHDEFASREPAAHPTRGEGREAHFIVTTPGFHRLAIVKERSSFCEE